MKIKSMREDGIVIYTFKTKCFEEWCCEYQTTLSLDKVYWDTLEGYSTKEEAERGHNKYLNMSREELINLDYISQ